MSKRHGIFTEHFTIFTNWKRVGIRVLQIVEDHFLEMI